MAGDKQAKWRQARADRFRILHRDKFSCRYCGSRPGSDLLEVDHLVPRSRGGSDNESNLVTACKTCNGRKSDTIVFPHDLIEGQDDEGWFIHKTYGEWKIVFSDVSFGVEKYRYGFIDGGRFFRERIMSHLYSKGWDHAVLADMERAVDHMRGMLSEDFFRTPANGA
jgi:hypothetical protein